MTRLVLPTLLLLAPAAAAQIPAPWDRPPGYSTGFGPGLRFAPFDPGRRHVPFTFQANPTPPYARPAFGPGFGAGFGFAPPAFGPVVGVPLWGGFYGGVGGTTVVIDRYPEPVPVPVPAGPAAVPLDPAHLSTALGNQRAARTAAAVTLTTGVTLALPADGEVWLNGVKQPGPAREYDLAVATARPGDAVRFDITARWPAAGRTLEYTRSLTLSAGERQSLAVVRGEPVGDKVTR